MEEDSHCQGGHNRAWEPHVLTVRKEGRQVTRLQLIGLLSLTNKGLRRGIGSAG